MKKPLNYHGADQQRYGFAIALVAHLVGECKAIPGIGSALKQAGGILHVFSGSYHRAEKTRKAVQQFPLDALVQETDAPTMPLAGF